MFFIFNTQTFLSSSFSSFFWWHVCCQVLRNVTESIEVRFSGNWLVFRAFSSLAVCCFWRLVLQKGYQLARLRCLHLCFWCLLHEWWLRLQLSRSSSCTHSHTYPPCGWVVWVGPYPSFGGYLSSSVISMFPNLLWFFFVDVFDWRAVV